MDTKELDTRFTYHAPTGTQPERYAAIRAKAKALAELFEASCPESREKALAFTDLESAVMWANASIARRENQVPRDSEDVAGRRRAFHQL